MKGSKRRTRRIKKRLRSKHSRRYKRRYSRRHMRGGSFQPAMTTPNYPSGYDQYSTNQIGPSNTQSIGGHLYPQYSALANPPPQQIVANANIPDNLNHNTLNSYGNIGAGSGFPSRG